MTEKKRTFDLMKNFKIEHAVLEFAGGGDSGGVENATFTDKNNIEVKIGEHLYTNQCDNKTKRFIDTPLSKHQMLINEFRDLLAKPIYETYYSFAFEGYVDGKVIWNATEKTCKMQAQEESTIYDYITKEF